MLTQLFAQCISHYAALRVLKGARAPTGGPDPLLVLGANAALSELNAVAS